MSREQSLTYAAFTFDGGLIFECATTNALIDAVVEHIAAQRLPHIAFTFDKTPLALTPYATWHQVVGRRFYLTLYSTYGEVADEFQRRAREAAVARAAELLPA